MPRRPLLLLCAFAAMLVAGCGSTTVRHVTVTVTGSATSTAASSSATAPASTPSSATSTSTSSSTASTTTASKTRGGLRRGHASSVAGRSARGVIAAAVEALRSAHGYTMRADLHQNGSRTVLDLDADGSHRFDASLRTGRLLTELIELPGASYLRGNAAFWRTHAGSSPAGRARARALASHWLRLRASATQSVTKTLGSLAPSVVARCLAEDHGTLTVAGRATVAGTRAVLVHDAGDAPGATPSTIAIAATGPAYPLRYVATGATRKGGRVDVCNDGKGGDAEGTITFAHFGDVPKVHAPIASGSAPGGSTA